MHSQGDGSSEAPRVEGVWFFMRERYTSMELEEVMNRAEREQQALDTRQTDLEQANPGGGEMARY
jgi:hypothetical protein